MSDSQRKILASGAAELGITLSEHQLDQFDGLTALLLEWNAKFNLTRITNPSEIAVKHYLDSLSLLAYAKMPARASLIDVGTGAGLPGLPLKIAVPEMKLALLDSVKKKLLFAEEAAKELQLGDVKTIHARAEDAARDKSLREHFDFAVSRAVARLSVLAELCIPFCKVGGKFVAYKGPESDEEIAETERAFRVLGGKLETVEKFTLPQSDSRRTLILVKKTRPTPGPYPRKAGTPAREPLI
ncbi:MAG TPA: 16S rRNA (guanine(527)-N(7))-methyltransferase RsmG [Armatimonadota bacterium]|jgi:16S rRNA (guanine527-N7)-methyltransferase